MTAPEIEFSEHHPIIVTEKEWDYLKGRRFKVCLHKWTYRQARPVGEFKVVCNDHVRIMNLPAGRICSKCGKIEWVANKGAERPWQQSDLTPDP
jgi:hypothetical protein